MAAFKFTFNTQTGHANIGQIGIVITPDALVTTGYYAFGVIAPNGQALKTINPNFYNNPTGGSSDFDATTTAVITDSLVAIPLNSNNDYMSGDYQLSVAYVENLSNATVNSRDITTVTFNFCNPKSGGQYKGVLTSTFNALTSQLVVNDVTDYTNATRTSHTLSSVLVSGGSPITTTALSQTLTLAAYTSTLTANANRIYATIYADITIQWLFTVTATINSPTEYITYKQTIDLAATVLNTLHEKMCNFFVLSISENYKILRIHSFLCLINSYAAIGDDVNLNIQLGQLYTYLKRC